MFKLFVSIIRYISMQCNEKCFFRNSFFTMYFFNRMKILFNFLVNYNYRYKQKFKNRFLLKEKIIIDLNLFFSHRNIIPFKQKMRLNIYLQHLNHQLLINLYHHLLYRQPIDHQQDHLVPIIIVQHHRQNIMKVVQVHIIQLKVYQAAHIQMKLNPSNVF
jgi:hypothetical protein